MSKIDACTHEWAFLKLRTEPASKTSDPSVTYRIYRCKACSWMKTGAVL